MMMDERSFNVAVYQSSRAPQGINLSVTDSDLSKLLQLREVVCAPCRGKMCREKLGGMLWAPTKNVGGYRQQVESVSMLVLDVDAVPRADLDATFRNLEGYRYLAYSTHSYTADRPSVHLVMPLAQDGAPEVVRGAASRVRGFFEVPPWTETWEPRIWYLPTRPAGADYRVREGQGALLDLEAFA
jgi:hypothetical protein